MDISLYEPEQLARLSPEEASEYLNGAADRVCPDDESDRRFYPLRLALEDAHDSFMDLMESYLHMKEAGVAAQTIVSSGTLRRQIDELVDKLNSVVETARAAGIHSFDEKCGNAGMQTGFFIRGMQVILETHAPLKAAMIEQTDVAGRPSLPVLSNS